MNALAKNYPLPAWPQHLPTPSPVYGISEDGTDVPDLMLSAGDRKVYMQADRGPDGAWYDDIDDDPAWQTETPETRRAVVAYGRTLLDRYVAAIGEAWTTPEGSALLALVHRRLDEAGA